MQNEVILQNIKRIDNDIDFFYKELEKINKQLYIEISSLIAEQNISGAIDLAITKSTIQQAMVNSGYYKMVDKLLNEEYQKIIDMNIKEYYEVYGKEFAYKGTSIEQLNMIKEMDFSQFAQLSDKSTVDLTKILLNNQMGILDKKQSVEAMVKSVDQLSQYAGTWVDTAISGYYRKSGLQLGVDNGINNYEYYGPDDKLTRPFCLDALKAGVKTLEEWDSMDNGQLNPVSIYGGGWQCRHRLVAVVD